MAGPSRHSDDSGEVSPRRPHDHPELPGFRAVLFDLDGLVLDTEPTYLHAWRKAAAEFGATLDEEAAHALFGHHADDVERMLRARIGPAFERARFHAAAEQHWRQYLEAHGIACMPGLFDLLDLLVQREIPYALATNSDAPYATLCLQRAGVLPRFSVRVSRDQVARGKPEPDLFLEAARKLGVHPGRCLTLEDTPTGLEAARRAGTLPVLVQARPVSAETRAMALACFSSLGEVAAAISLRSRTETR